MTELKINPNFKAAIPPLDADEYAKLRESIKTDGCRDPIVIWDGVIIDGHNRFQLCTELNIPFNTVEKTFADETAALEWIMFNQLGRRNLPDVERGRIALKLKDSIAARAKTNQSLVGGDRALPAKLPEALKPIDTRKELAKMAGIGERTLAKIEKVDNEAPASLKEAMGKSISIDKAAKLNEAIKLVPETERESEVRRRLLKSPTIGKKFAEVLELEKSMRAKQAETDALDAEEISLKMRGILTAIAPNPDSATARLADIYSKINPTAVAGAIQSIEYGINWLGKLKGFLQAKIDQKKEDVTTGKITNFIKT